MTNKDFLTACKWIAYNDNPTDLEITSIEGYVTVGLVSDLFDKSVSFTANIILTYRTYHANIISAYEK